MSEETARSSRQLGRGLSALFGDDGPETSPNPAQRDRSNMVPIEFLTPSRFQPRRVFEPEALNALVESVRDRGVLQPLIVRRDATNPNRYEIIAGERRWRAAQHAKLHEVPVVVQDLTDEAALEVALIENIQRQDLNPLEEAEGYNRLMEEFSHTQEELARVVGKSRSHVANMLRLLQLPAGVKTMVIKGELSAGHARALLNTVNAEQLAKKVVKRGLSVRQTEKLVQRTREPGGGSGKSSGGGSDKDADTIALERDLSSLLGLKVQINFTAEGGDLVVHYKTVDQLNDVIQRLSSRK